MTSTLVVVALLSAGAPNGRSSESQDTFRAGVSLIAIDVQVTDTAGVPIEGLGRDAFRVRIGRRQQPVASVQFVRDFAVREFFGRLRAASVSDGAASNGGLQERSFVIAVDAPSFAPGDLLTVLNATRQFVTRLPADARVGVVGLPFGPYQEPTIDAVRVRTALGQIVGQRQLLSSTFNLSLIEVVDITSQSGHIRTQGLSRGRGAGLPASPSNETVRSVQRRECEADPECLNYLLADAEMLAQQMEQGTVQSLRGLSTLLNVLRTVPGRKTVLVLSAGMPVSDRSGGRPEPPDIVRLLGEQAARSNAVVYSIHVDRQLRTSSGAQARAVANQTNDARREQQIQTRLLADFTAPSGGTMLTALTDDGDRAFDRVLSETSAYYLLGVDPGGIETDKPHEVRVDVSARGATVRSRRWVIVPPRR